jgi:hypothetical protein
LKDRVRISIAVLTSLAGSDPQLSTTFPGLSCSRVSQAIHDLATIMRLATLTDTPGAWLQRRADQAAALTAACTP